MNMHLLFSSMDSDPLCRCISGSEIKIHLCIVSDKAAVHKKRRYPYVSIGGSRLGSNHRNNEVSMPPAAS